ncbi:uncharacterized protein PG986_014228 [Apiospora aurea]|uniref:Uncharacterized protein n=1 Tax=Apiospora aurea TaxID=335848 RepID=A0ABR1PSW1_9PEZI
MKTPGLSFVVRTAMCLVGNGAVLAAAVKLAPNTANRPEFLPRGVSLGHELSSKTDPLPGGGFALNSTAPLATLDYGTEVAGIPFFSVSAVETAAEEHSVQVEVRYSEAYSPLAHPWSDGPYPFAVSLANAIRVETFNVSTSGSFASPLVQGGQRWQSIRLLSTGEGDSAASLSFDRVGFQATVDPYDVTDMPATFQCDDDELNAIWGLGAAAAATACVEKGTQPAVWEVDPDKGVLLRSQKPAVWAHGFAFANYTMEFDTMIERGGVWWTVAMSNGGYPTYLQLRLVGELPEATTFANVNKTLAPANSVLVSYGFDFINQTTLTSLLFDTFPVPGPVAEKSWHKVKTVLAPSGHLAVSLDGQEIFNISMSDYYTAGNTVSFTGSFGVGAWQDEVAYARNLAVTANGSTLYTHPLTKPDALRDRLVWLGDFYHPARVVGSSTARFDMARGTLDFMLGTQGEGGTLAIDTPLGYGPAIPGTGIGLEDYRLLGDRVLHHVRSRHARSSQPLHRGAPVAALPWGRLQGRHERQPGGPGDKDLAQHERLPP